MIKFRPIVFLIGILLSALAVVMLIPALVDVLTGYSRDASVFAVSAGFTLFIGVSAVLAARADEPEIDVRQSFVLAALGWAVAAAFAALPLGFSDLGLDPTSAFFEAMAGVTSTAATAITGLDGAPPGILLWRALLQWFGGFGMIAIAITVLPVLQVGGMQIFRLESAGGAQRVLPRAAQILTGVGLIYVGLTAACATALWATGMTGFEAVVHAMTTISTGGFSTSDQSIAHFRSGAVEAIVILFMILGSLPFLLYLQALRGSPRRLLRDGQVFWFLGMAAAAVVLMTYWRWHHDGEPLPQALRMAAFNIVSVVTGTGFTTASYDTWGGVAIAAFLFLMVVGGCAGSTSSGIKIFRFQVIYEAADVQIKRLIQPSGLFVPEFNERPIPDTVANAVMGFFFLFAASYAILALGLGAMGLDTLTCLSGAASAIANVGPGLGPVIGPEGNYAALPDGAKWLLSFGMLVGRLDLYTVLVLFVPAFWRG
ncbi:MAG TPA: TrkH family potassium uptake protein [Alphaproteobacteria bacterium]|jgi:trk system potassium uptake protein TrkH|nr:TrkH family potassium uptake protein [Alphaproteobacteria bacterium]